MQEEAREIVQAAKSRGCIPHKPDISLLEKELDHMSPSKSQYIHRYFNNTINNPDSDNDLDFLEYLLQDEEIMIAFLTTAAAAKICVHCTISVSDWIGMPMWQSYSKKDL